MLLQTDQGALVVMIIPVQSVPITTKDESLNPILGELYSIQHNVIKFVSDLRQVDGFLWVLRFPPPIKLTATILLKVALSTINQANPYYKWIKFLLQVIPSKRLVIPV